MIPGMIASPLSVDDGYSMGDDIQWGAGHDSFYEVSSTTPQTPPSSEWLFLFFGFLFWGGC